MSLCVEIDGSGYIVESIGQTPPACSEFLLTTAQHFDRLTYWADLAIELDPTGATFAALLGLMITSAGVVLGSRMGYDWLRKITKES